MSVLDTNRKKDEKTKKQKKNKKGGKTVHSFIHFHQNDLFAQCITGGLKTIFKKYLFSDKFQSEVSKNVDMQIGIFFYMIKICVKKSYIIQRNFNLKY